MHSIFRKSYPYSFLSIKKEWENCIKTVGEKQAFSIYKKTKLSEKTPVILGIGITTKCNLFCLYCYYKEYGNSQYKHKELSVLELEKILSDIPFLQNLIFTLEGEPFLHSDFYTVLEIASKYCSCITVVTNANIQFNQQIKRLKNTAVKNIIISIDSPNAKNYESIRKGAKFSLLCQNINLLKNYTEIIQFHSIISNKNESSITDLPFLAKKLGINILSFSQVRETDFTRHNKIFSLETDKLKNVLLKIIENSYKTNTALMFDEHFASYSILKWLQNNFYNNPLLYIHIPKNKMCSTIWNYTSITTNKALFPCCGDLQPIKLDAFTFNTIYNNEYLRILRALWFLKHVPQVCKTCLFL